MLTGFFIYWRRQRVLYSKACLEIEKGVKISRVSKLLGHTKEVTTVLYIVNDKEKGYEDVLNSLF